LDLGRVPLANALLPAGFDPQQEPCWPLEWVFCPGCGLAQIIETIDPETLFREYVYFSSVSDALLEHSRAHVHALCAERALGPTHQVVEIASNDGYLLQYFAHAGVPVLGIEPARNIAAVARERGIPTRCEFFDAELARTLRDEGVRADVILANNVLAHVPDLNGFVEGIATLLAPGGIAELEVPWLLDLVDRLAFDTIYHEHLCYFSVHALQAVFERHALVLTDVKHLAVHGGSIRVRVEPAQSAPLASATVSDFLTRERDRDLHRFEAFADFAERVGALCDALRARVAALKADGQRIVAYGASAKGTTLLSTCGIGAETLDYVVDRSVAKQGLYTPGAHLLVRPPEVLLEDQPDYALLLTWNFADEILDQQAEYRRQGGQFIVPIPEVRIV